MWNCEVDQPCAHSQTWTVFIRRCVQCGHNGRLLKAKWPQVARGLAGHWCCVVSICQHAASVTASTILDTVVHGDLVTIFTSLAVVVWVPDSGPWSLWGGPGLSLSPPPSHTHKHCKAILWHWQTWAQCCVYRKSWTLNIGIKYLGKYDMEPQVGLYKTLKTGEWWVLMSRIMASSSSMTPIDLSTTITHVPNSADLPTFWYTIFYGKYLERAAFFDRSMTKCFFPFQLSLHNQASSDSRGSPLDGFFNTKSVHHGFEPWMTISMCCSTLSIREEVYIQKRWKTIIIIICLWL